MIREADKVRYQGEKLTFGDTGAYAFGYYRGDMRVVKEETHQDIQIYYKDMNPEYSFWADVPDDKQIKRGGLEYPGRVWTKQKVISFWEYPKDGDKLKEILSDINKELEDRYGKTVDWNSGWKIEIVDESLPGEGTRKTDRKELVDIENYIGSGERSKEDLARGHMDPDVGAGGVDKGTYQSKKQKGKRMDRYPGGGEAEKFGYRTGDDPEYSDELGRFREMVRKKVKSLLTEDPDHFNLVDKDGDVVSFWSDQSDAVPFVVLNEEVVVGNTMGSEHGEMVNNDRFQKLKTGSNVDPWSRSGRVWIDQGAISFWWRPSKKELENLIPKLERRLTKHKKGINISDDWYVDIPTKEEASSKDLVDSFIVPDDYVTMKLGEYTEEESKTFSGHSDIEQRHQDPDVGAGGVDKGTYKKKKQKGKEKERYPGGGETEKLGYKVGGDPEYSQDVERFREVVRDLTRSLLNETPNEFPDPYSDYKKLSVSTPGALAFGIYDGEFVIGDELEGAHSTSVYPSTDNFDEVKEGRVWLGHDVISFWWQPSGSEVSRVISELEKEVNQRFDFSVDIDEDWILHYPIANISTGRSTGDYETVKIKDFEGNISRTFDRYSDREERHQDPDVGAGGVDKGTYQSKKQKGKKKDRYPGGGETERLGYKVGGDTEYSDEIERFREVIKEAIKKKLE